MTPGPSVLIVRCLAAAAFAAGPCGAAPVPITGTMTYTQSFDSLGNQAREWIDDSTIPGWYAQMNNGLTPAGTLQVSNGTNGNLNGLLNLGTAGSSDRSLGSKATGTGNMANIAFAVQFRNISGRRILFTKLTYTGELWRTNSSSGVAEQFFPSYAISPARIYHIASGPSSATPQYGGIFQWYGNVDDWTSPTNSPAASALDGNAPGNRATINFPPGLFAIEPGEYFMIRWTDTNPGGTDGHQGLDDVSVSFRTLDGPGDLDPGFNANANDAVRGLAMQPDGKILISGSFGTVSSFPRTYAARLLPDGTLDPGFQPGITYTELTSYVTSALLHADGRVFLAGQFTTAGSSPRMDLVRLSSAGVPESAFTADTDGLATGAAFHPDGNLLIAGQFNSINQATGGNLVSADLNGAVRSQFKPQVNGPVYTTAVQPDGRILIGGTFSSVAGLTRNFIARLNPDGSPDDTFDSPFIHIQFSSSIVDCIALQADGRILLSGRVATAGQTPERRIVRLHPDGTRDASFTSPTTGSISCILVQTDGKVICAGSINMEKNILRCHPDGSLDESFSGLTDQAVRGAVLQSDGRIVVGGEFQRIGPANVDNPARLLNDPATQSLAPLGVTGIRWLRGGSSPETHFVTFDLSSDDGATWTPLGAGARIDGGWERTALSLPAAGHLRARARTTGGIYNASSGLVETIVPYALSPLQMWRHQHFGAAENSDAAQDNADPDNDGLENLVEYAFSLNPRVPDNSALPAWRWENGEFVLTFVQADGVEGISCRAEYSTTLDPAGWTSVPNTATPPGFDFHVPAGVASRLFLRIRVTAP